METLQFQDELGRAMLDICKRVPYGVLCFLPSYAFMEKLINRMKAVGFYDKLAEMKRIFLEPRSGPPKEFETLMKRYYACISACKEGIGFTEKSSGITGAVFFAVYRGKVSEGLDLADENCRAVIPIGIPYPAFKDQKVIQKREFNDMRNSATRGMVLNGMQWYETQAFRALNQALGRCIRHRLDWGAIILLEQRFTYPTNVKHLSKWVRSDVRTYSRFSDGMLALDQFVARNQSNDKELSAEISAIKAEMHQEVSIEEDEY
jgi:Fanconi anemia group J protein